jgi:GNAT superfamily N-acetyltransferase
VTFRVATDEDVEALVAVLVSAFYDDPGWAWGFPNPALRRAQQGWFWRLCVEAAMPHGWVWQTSNGASAAVWVPPGESDMSDETFEPLARAALGVDADRLLRTVERFEAAHPVDEPHFYLSLLGTHVAQWGHGYGFALLADNLRRIDETGMPCYLESSNAANVPHYEKFGFAVRGSFAMPDGGPDIVTMWRDPV